MQKLISKKNRFVNLLGLNLVCIGLLAFSILSTFFYFLQIFHPGTSDVLEYKELGFSAVENGILNTDLSWRPFLYPQMLAVIFRIAKFLIMPENLILFIFQTSIYAISSICLVSSIGKQNVLAAKIMFVMLSFNIFVIPYLGISLTDGISFSLVILFLATWTKIESHIAAKNIVLQKHIFFLTIISASAVEIRPQNFFLIVFTLYFLIHLKFRTKIALVPTLTTFLFGLFPFLVQLTINATNFRKISVTPPNGLLALNMDTGIRLVKHATGMPCYKCDPKIIAYPSNQLFQLPKSDGVNLLGLEWYTSNFWSALKLVGLKFVGIFDYENLVPYIYRVNQLANLPSFVSFSIVILGLIGIVLHAKRRQTPQLGSRVAPIFFAISWCLTTLFAAGENRYGFPLMLYFGFITSFLIAGTFVNQKKYDVSRMVAAFCVLMVLFVFTASFVRSLRV